MIGVGNTPLIPLGRISEPGCARIYAKWEGANRTGSMKDRMALAMVQGAARRGELRPGGRVVDYTGGSTGSSLAMVCSALGYRAHFVSSDCFAEEKLQTMRAFGAVVELIPSEGGKVTAALIQACLARVAELRAEPDTFWTDQFNNPDNRAGYVSMAHEVLRDLDAKLDEFVVGVGTGGCLSGHAEVFRREAPQVRCVAVEPFNSQVIAGEAPRGGHRLEGMGAGFVPSLCESRYVDAVVPVRDEDALVTARRLAREEGIFGGISSGANVWAALERARRLGPDARVVTVVCDSGLKYLRGDLYGAG